MIDETKGFVIFDDLEWIGSRKPSEAVGLSEPLQSSQLDQNKARSGLRGRVRAAAGTSKGCFGMKMINNNTGADHILDSRLLKVFMQRMQKSSPGNLFATEEWNPVVLQKLRDERTPGRSRASV